MMDFGSVSASRIPGNDKRRIEGVEMLRIIRCIGRACRLHSLATVLTGVPPRVASSAAPAAFPDRVITLLVPFAAGGPTDISARIVSLACQKSLGQSVVVEN